MALTQAQQEAMYDAQRDGSAYIRNDADDHEPCSPAWEAILNITADSTNDGRPIPIVRSRDAAHREERWIAILEEIAAMDEPDQSRMLGYMAGLFAGMKIGQHS